MNLLTDLCSIGISFYTDGMRVLYFIVSTFVFLMCTLFSKEYFKGEHSVKRFFTFWIITYLAVVGFLFSGDYFTQFMFFEIMSVASSFWVLQEENEDSDYAGRLYLRISIACGLVTLFGIMLLYHLTGTLSFTGLAALRDTGFTDPGLIKAAAFLIFVGFGAKAGVFLLHIWLPKAHTVAPAPASAVLSGILTKTGIFGIMITASVLGIVSDEASGRFFLVLGACTMFTGAALAVFSTNLKRTLACSSVSQIGFIVTGISCMILTPGAFAFTGTLLHMLNHSMIKLVLFLCAGGILKKTGSLDLNEIRGYGKNKKALMIPFFIGAASISGIPFFSGYVSKTLIHEAVEALEIGTLGEAVNIVFTVTGGITLCYMTKLFVCIFVEEGPAKKKDSLSALSLIAINAGAVVIFLAGIYPPAFAHAASFGTLSEYFALIVPDFSEVFEMHWFAFHTLKGGLISISIGIVLYLVVVRFVTMKGKGKEKKYINALPFWFDLEKYVYRPLFLAVLPFLGGLFSRVLDKTTDFIAYFFFRKKLFKPLMNKRNDKVSKNKVSYGIGSLLDLFSRNKYHDEKKSFTERLAVFSAEASEMARNLERSLSLSMLLYSVGLLITLIVMLIKIS